MGTLLYPDQLREAKDLNYRSAEGLHSIPTFSPVLSTNSDILGHRTRERGPRLWNSLFGMAFDKLYTFCDGNDQNKNGIRIVDSQVG